MTYADKVEHEDFTVSGDGEPEDEKTPSGHVGTFFGKSLRIVGGPTGKDSHVLLDGKEVPVFGASVNVAPGDYTRVELQVAGHRFQDDTVVEGILVDPKTYEQYREWMKGWVT